MLSAAIILAIAIAIYLGYKTSLNTGLFCIVFAYLIGCLVMGLKPKAVIGFWPVSTMFVILSVSLFYNVAAINGTLEKMSGSLLYACRKFPGMLPYALFGVAVVLSVMGATYFTVLAFLAPITLLICDESKMDKLTGAVAINCGALCGGNFPTSNLGVIFRGLSDTAYEALKLKAPMDSFAMEMEIFLLSLVFSLVLITVFRYGIKANRNIGQGVTFKKPEPFTKVQSQTLTLMLVMMVVVLIFPLLKILVPGNPAVAYMAGKVDVGLVAIIFAVIALLMKLAPQKEAIAKIPWNTIIMIAGAGMLLGGGQCAHAVDSPGVLHHCGHHELLQFHHRCSGSCVIPADSGAGGKYRAFCRGTVRLHGAGRTIQCHQPVLFRRLPDPGLHAQRRRPDHPVQQTAAPGCTRQRPGSRGLQFPCGVCAVREVKSAE